MTAEMTIIVLCAAASAFCFGISLVPAHSPLALRLVKLQSIGERAPGKRTELIARVVDEEGRSRLQDRLTAAGWYHVTPTAMILRSAGSLAAGLAVGILVAIAVPAHVLGFVFAVALALVASRLPKIALDRAIKRRQTRVLRTLPDFLDLLAATVRAGLALNMALIQAAEGVGGPLSDELRSTLAEMRLGRPRGQALKAMAHRIGETQTRTMVAAIVEADRLGANISAVLGELSVDTRNQRWMSAEEKAARLPILMVFPMALLMLPSLYLMIFGPLVAHLVASR